MSPDPYGFTFKAKDHAHNSSRTFNVCFGSVRPPTPHIHLQRLQWPKTASRAPVLRQIRVAAVGPSEIDAIRSIIKRDKVQLWVETRNVDDQHRSLASENIVMNNWQRKDNGTAVNSPPFLHGLPMNSISNFAQRIRCPTNIPDYSVDRSCFTSFQEHREGFSIRICCTEHHYMGKTVQ